MPLSMIVLGALRTFWLKHLHEDSNYTAAPLNPGVAHLLDSQTSNNAHSGANAFVLCHPSKQKPFKMTVFANLKDRRRRTAVMWHSHDKTLTQLAKVTFQKILS